MRFWFAWDGHTNDDPEVQEKIRKLGHKPASVFNCGALQKLKRLAGQRSHGQISCVRQPRQRNDRGDQRLLTFMTFLSGQHR
jgi:hypothetical protein